MLVVAAVGEVEADEVHPGAQQLPEHPVLPARRPQGGHDLGPPLHTGREYSCAFRRSQVKKTLTARVSLAPPFLAVLFVALLVPIPAAAQPACAAEQARPLVPADPALCERLLPIVQRPGALPLAEYEAKLGDFLRAFCHRDAAKGWKRDKGVRDTGPFTATLADGKWTGTYRGTHAPVVVWYSQEMVDWMRANRPVGGHAAPARRRRSRTARSWSRRCSRRRPPPAPASIRCTFCRRAAPRSWCATGRPRRTAGSGAGSAGAAGPPTGRRTPPTATPSWASGSTASTATPRRATSSPSPA